MATERKKFVIEVGFCKGKYAPRYSFTADEEAKAIMYYNGINIGRGYKKRIKVNGKVKARVMPDSAYCPSRRR